MGSQATINYHALNGIVAGGPELAASQKGMAGAQTVATLPGAAGVTTVITHMTVTADNVPAVVAGTVQVTGVVGGPLNFELVETVSAGGYMDHIFIPPLPATGPNTSITVTVPAITNGSIVSIVVEGWQG